MTYEITILFIHWMTVKRELNNKLGLDFDMEHYYEKTIITVFEVKTEKEIWTLEQIEKTYSI